MRLDIDLTQGKIKRNVYFTSDFHLFHHNVIRFDSRPFVDVHEMHKVIEERWNEVITKDDTVIYLGDLTFARREDKAFVEAMVGRLKGDIHYVMGNHDKLQDIKKFTQFKTIQDYLEVRIAHNQNDKRVETLFCCMHYPIYSWNKAHHGSILVHGHSHMNLSEGEFHKTHRIFDVGCMGYEYKPVSYLELIKKAELIDFNLVNNHH